MASESKVDETLTSLICRVDGAPARHSMFTIDVSAREHSAVCRVASALRTFIGGELSMSGDGIFLHGGIPLKWVGKSIGMDMPTSDFDFTSYRTFSPSDVQKMTKVAATIKKYADGILRVDGVEFRIVDCATLGERERESIFLLRLETTIDGVTYDVDFSDKPSSPKIDFFATQFSVLFTDDDPDGVLELCSSDICTIMSLYEREAQPCVLLRDKFSFVRHAGSRDDLLLALFRMYKMSAKFPILDCGTYTGKDGDHCPVCIESTYDSLSETERMMRSTFVKFKCGHGVCFKCTIDHHNRFSRGRAAITSCPTCRGPLKFTDAKLSVSSTINWSAVRKAIKARWLVDMLKDFRAESTGGAARTCSDDAPSASSSSHPPPSSSITISKMIEVADGPVVESSASSSGIAGRPPPSGAGSIRSSGYVRRHHVFSSASRPEY